MAKLVLLNALASTAGGGLTYLNNVLPRLAEARGAKFLTLVPPEKLENFRRWANNNLSVETVKTGGALKRMWWEQTKLDAFARARGAQAVVALGNFAMLRSAAPQLLFNRNDLYFSPVFAADLQRRGEWGKLAKHRAQAWLARQSIKRATLNVAPTAAFAAKITARAGLQHVSVEVLPFGFDANAFPAQAEPLSATQLAALRPGQDCHRLLFVSHYNYFRNFETLLRALPSLRAQLLARTGRDVLLVLTTNIQRGAIYGGYDATEAAALIDRLQMHGHIAMLGSIEYAKLPELYRACDAFVCPSYAESFGHPLLEAMAAGLPVIASDLPVQREVCGDAARYFATFDEHDLAETCAGVLADEALKADLKARGLAQSKKFSWDAHVRRLLQLIETLL